MKHKIYWVGPRKSDISFVKDIDFYGSITLFGDGKDNNTAYCNANINRVNHNVSDEAEDLFFLSTIKSIIANDSSARFYCYNPNMLYYVTGLEEYRDYFICINDKLLMKNTNNKRFFHEKLEGVVPLLDRRFGEFHRNNSDYMSLLESFDRNKDEKCRFIFQAPISSGGNGTYIIDSENSERAVSQLKPDNYIISIYKEKNIPINIHAVIFDNEILLSPGSVQIMREDDSRLLYRGADFIAYRQINRELREKFENYVIDACKEFRALGYRGICGIDGMIYNTDNGDSEVVLLEINNRFQASTSLIDIAADRAGLPSMQKINLAAFMGQWDDRFSAIRNLDVNYSSYFYIDNGTKFHSNLIRSVCREYARKNELDSINVFDVEDDGYEPDGFTNSLAYLFRVVFSTNIAALNAESCIRIHENISEPSKKMWYDKIVSGFSEAETLRSKALLRDYFIRLKIALLTQGVVKDNSFCEYLNKNNKSVRPATNNAIDIKINLPQGICGEKIKRCLVINTPVDVKFVEFSPFAITREADKNYIYYYGTKLMQIDETYDRDFLSDKEVDGIAYNQVAFLSTDRLRVHITNSCVYKKNRNTECKFCNIKAQDDDLPLSTIEKVVKDYCSHARELGLKHFMIGGQTASSLDHDKIVSVVKIIRKYAAYADIYAMIVPYPEKTIEAMFKAGMNQISCNLEVFDDEIAKRYCPGKRSVTKDEYVRRLRFATTLMGRTGAVRSMLIVGLEPFDSLKIGIEELSANGIQPILSVFRPLPETELENMCAPSMSELYDIYVEAQRICKSHGLLLGPQCVNCQNNTLALPYWMEN